MELDSTSMSQPRKRSARQLLLDLEVSRRELDEARYAGDILRGENVFLSKATDRLAGGELLTVAREFESRGRVQMLRASRVLIWAAVSKEQPQHLERAQALLVKARGDHVVASDPNGALEGPELEAQITKIQQDLDASRSAFQARRRSTGELAAGGVMAGVFVSSAVLFARSAAWHAAVGDQIAVESGHGPSPVIDDLRRLEQRTESHMVASAIAGTFALVLSVTLLTLGVRDRARLRRLRLSWVR